MKRYTYYPMVERIRKEPVFRSPKNMFLKILMYAGVFLVMSLAESFGSVALLIQQLLESLDDVERELVVCKYHDGMRNVDIARELHMNASTVSTKLANAISKMRAVMQKGS